MEAGGIERDSPSAITARKCGKTLVCRGLRRVDLTTQDPFRLPQTASIGHSSGTREIAEVPWWYSNQESPWLPKEANVTDRTMATPLKAIRLKCLDCCPDQAQEVRQYPVGECTLYPYRFGRRPKTKPRDVPPTLKAIRARCLDCSGGSTKEARDCTFTGCSLHPYRMGRNPNRAGIGGKPPSNRGKAGTGAPDALDGKDRPRIVA